jgi:hypothetical protein
MPPSLPLPTNEPERLATLNVRELRFERQARIRAERDLALTSQIMMATAQAPTGSKALEDALRLIADDLRAGLATAWECLWRGDQLRIAAAVVEPGRDLTAELKWLRQLPLTLTNSLTGRALRYGKPELITNLAERIPDFAVALIARGFDSVVSVPIAQSGNEFVLHFFFKGQPKDPEHFAERIGLLTEHLRPALGRKASERNRSLFESIVLNAGDGALVAVPEISLGHRLCKFGDDPNDRL